MNDAAQQRDIAESSDVVVAIERLGANVNGNLHGINGRPAPASVPTWTPSSPPPRRWAERPSASATAATRSVFGKIREALMAALPDHNQETTTPLRRRLPVGHGDRRAGGRHHVQHRGLWRGGGAGDAAGATWPCCTPGRSRKGCHYVGVGLGLADGGGGGIVPCCDGIPAEASAAHGHAARRPSCNATWTSPRCARSDHPPALRPRLSVAFTTAQGRSPRCTAWRSTCCPARCSASSARAAAARASPRWRMMRLLPEPAARITGWGNPFLDGADLLAQLRENGACAGMRGRELGDGVPGSRRNSLNPILTVGRQLREGLARASQGLGRARRGPACGGAAGAGADAVAARLPRHRYPHECSRAACASG